MQPYCASITTACAASDPKGDASRLESSGLIVRRAPLEGMVQEFAADAQKTTRSVNTNTAVTGKSAVSEVVMTTSGYAPQSDMVSQNVVTVHKGMQMRQGPPPQVGPQIVERCIGDVICLAPV